LVADRRTSLRHMQTSSPKTLAHYLGTAEFNQRVVQRPPYVLELAASLLDCLCALHGAGQAHGDLRPANIVVEALRDKPECRLVESSRRPPSPYMAPEVSDARYDAAAADIYSFAMVLYALLHNREAVDACERPDLAPQVPVCWANVVTSCWRQSPLARPRAETLWRTFSGYLGRGDPCFWLLSFYDEQLVVNVADPHAGRMFRFPRVPRHFTVLELKNQLSRQNFRRVEVLVLFAERRPNQQLHDDAPLPAPVGAALNLVLMTSYCRVRVETAFPLCFAATNIPLDAAPVLNIPWSAALTVAALKQEITRLCEFTGGLTCALSLDGVALADDATLAVAYLPSTTLPFIDCLLYWSAQPVGMLQEFYALHRNVPEGVASCAHYRLYLQLLRDSVGIVRTTQQQTKSLITGTPYDDGANQTTRLCACVFNAYLPQHVERCYGAKLIALYCQCLMRALLDSGASVGGGGGYLYAWCAEKMCAHFGVLLMGLGLATKEKLLETRASHIWNATCSFKAFAIGEKYAATLAQGRSKEERDKLRDIDRARFAEDRAQHLRSKADRARQLYETEFFNYFYPHCAEFAIERVVEEIQRLSNDDDDDVGRKLAVCQGIQSGFLYAEEKRRRAAIEEEARDALRAQEAREMNERRREFIAKNSKTDDDV
jgi:hypothetical protein